MSQSIQIESAVIHGWIEAYYDDNSMVTACMHDGSAVSAVLQNDNVIGKWKVKARDFVGVLRVYVCMCVCALVGGRWGILEAKSSFWWICYIDLRGFDQVKLMKTQA